jgi:hypothetical protein
MVRGRAPGGAQPAREALKAGAVIAAINARMTIGQDRARIALRAERFANPMALPWVELFRL